MPGAEYVDLPIYQDELASAFGYFTKADLEANRAGRLTVTERSFQFRAVTKQLAIGSASLVLAVACLAWVVSIGNWSGSSVPLLLISGCLLAFAARSAWFSIPLWGELNAGVVSSVEGFVRPAERPTSVYVGGGRDMRVWSYYWMVDDQDKFQVSGKAYAVLMPAQHRLYFLPRTRKVVAVEPISSALAGSKSEADGGGPEI